MSLPTKYEEVAGQNIEQGDFVTFYFVSRPCLRCMVLWAPCDTGDMWTVRSENCVIKINPMCSDLVWIEKEMQ